ncbi:hypothetical protein [Brevibacterium aurantiacum]|nr:hypothetical protein [Brevibacterium aurantiacum]
MSFDQWLNRGRRWWKTRADRALNADRLFVIDATNRVRAVGLVDGVLKDREDGSDRVSIEVTSEEDSELIGKIIRRNDSRNPISYVTTIEVVDQ